MLEIEIVHSKKNFGESLPQNESSYRFQLSSILKSLNSSSKKKTKKKNNLIVMALLVWKQCSTSVLG